MKNVLQRLVALQPRIDRSIIFARWCQCASLSSTWFLGPTLVCLPPNGISVGSNIFAELVIVTNRQTDRNTNKQIDVKPMWQ